MELFDGRPADTAGRLPREVRTYEYLDKLGIAYKRTDHERTGRPQAMELQLCQPRCVLYARPPNLQTVDLSCQQRTQPASISSSAAKHGRRCGCADDHQFDFDSHLELTTY